MDDAAWSFNMEHAPMAPATVKAATSNNLLLPKSPKNIRLPRNIFETSIGKTKKAGVA
jgi:hypothetical protein